MPLGDLDEFARSAQIGFNRLRQDLTPEDRADALINFAQEAINGGRFRQARRVISLVFELSDSTPVPHRFLTRARAHEKLAWVADYETGYRDGIEHLQNSKQLLNLFRTQLRSGTSEDSKWFAIANNCDSTVTHFEGRARVGLAAQGIDVSSNLQQADTLTP